MRTRAAVLFTVPGKWEVTEIELEPPGPGELLVKMGAAGLCHSDDHILMGDIPVPPGRCLSSEAMRAPASWPRWARIPRGGRSERRSS